ncbi:MAG: NADPH-dependent F420 reductase [Hyphomicrobiales bacterium]
MTASKPVLGIIGGTGALGSGLAHRFVAAGFPVIIGSRTVEKGEAAARGLVTPPGCMKPVGALNEEAAKAAEIVFITVPWASRKSILDAIRPHVGGKLVVDTTVPLLPPKVARVQLPPEGSAALATQNRLGSGARVVTAFHNVAAHKLKSAAAIDCDVLVFGDEPKDRAVVISLARAVGLRGLHAGPLANSAAGEALTSVLIGINRTYKVDGAGIRITGIVEG